MKVTFYEKPGCINNTKQKRMLLDAGYQLDERSLLTTVWQADELQSFFADMPVAEWFNRTAPAIKNDEIDPDIMDAAAALAAMQKDPLLIRRPLIEYQGQRMCGFAHEILEQRLGIRLVQEPDGGIEQCAKGGAEQAQQGGCPAPK